MEVHWYPTKRYTLGISESSAVPENSFFSPKSLEAIWARFPEGLFYRIFTGRSYLVTRKMSRPYEMILRPG